MSVVDLAFLPPLWQRYRIDWDVAVGGDRLNVLTGWFGASLVQFSDGRYLEQIIVLRGQSFPERCRTLKLCTVQNYRFDGKQSA